MDLTPEIIWGRYALNRRKITRAQLQTCIEKLGHLKEKGVKKSLFDIMLANGFIDRDIAQQIMNLEGMIPGYTMKGIIGTGGVGIVYRAYGEELNQDVAIKILNPEYTDNSIILNRFLREIEISKKLDHPNIVKGIDSGRIDDLYYLVLDYVDGPNLAVRVNQYGPLKDKAIVGVMVNVTRALYYAWKKGLTHRDIKPENIILTHSGEVKVCDFGLAKLADVNIALTVSGTIVGSPYYISPEQVHDSLNIDYRSDIYSLGATLYFTATGKMVFDEKTMIAICNAHSNKAPVLPSKYVPIDTDLEQLILRMLSKKKEDRCVLPKDFINLVNVVARKFKEPESFKIPTWSERPESNSAAVDTPVQPLVHPPLKTHTTDGTLPEESVLKLPPETIDVDKNTPDTKHAVVIHRDSTLEKHPTPAIGGSETSDLLKHVLEQSGTESKLYISSKIREQETDWVFQSSTSRDTHTGTKAEDGILRHLLLSLNIMDMAQFSQCMSFQVDLQLQGINKSLSELIVEKGYIDKEYTQNLKSLRDKKGQSLIPNYEIANTIGRGGNTIVYLARSTSTNATVAIKVFAPGTSENSSTIARFIREAQASKKLDHPNIVKAYEVGSAHGLYYLVMEYISGLSLSQIISKVGRLEEQKALAVLEQIADALTYAWEQNIIHRDIKPGNILSDGETIKICDLGLAKAMESEIQLTQEGSILGTPQFMAPEQFQSQSELDFRADVYSLGVTFYVMLTGNLPFNPSTKVGLAQAHLFQSPPPLEKFNCSVSKPTKALISKMLDKDPDRRCAKKEELIEDIRLVRHGKYPKNMRYNISVSKKILAAVALVVIVATVVILSMLRLSKDSNSKESLHSNSKEALCKEISILISARDYVQAKSKVLHADFEPEEKQKWLSTVAEAESKETEEKALLVAKQNQIREKIHNQVALLISSKDYQRAREEIYRSEFELNEKKKWLELVDEADRKQTALATQKAQMRDEIQKEIVSFVSRRDYEKAREKIQNADIDAEEKRQWLDSLNKTQEAAAVKIFQLTPAEGFRIYEEKVHITGSVECRDLNYILIAEKQAQIAKLQGNTWTFEGDVPLDPGKNTIHITVVLASGHRENLDHVLWREKLDTTAPDIVLLEPAAVEPGKKKLFLKDSLLLKGYATDNEKVKTISLDNRTLPVFADDNKLFFETTLSLKEGEQIITIVARDEKGNEAKLTWIAYLKPKGWFQEEMPDKMARGQKAGEYIWSPDQSVMVYVPEGEFWYGDPLHSASARGQDRKNSRKVQLSSYYIDKFEVTWQQYEKFCSSQNYQVPKKPSWGARSFHPVVGISIEDAQAYARWVGKKLPTTAQWIKAARGGIRIPQWDSHTFSLTKNPNPMRLYPWGDEAPNAISGREKIYRCNYCADDSFMGQAGDGYMYTARTGDFAQWSSPYGCCDMAGNVSEMCRDWYDENYLPTDAEENPTGPSAPCEYRVKMGGSFQSLADQCQITYRAKMLINIGDSQTGLRLVKEMGKADR